MKQTRVPPKAQYAAALCLYGTIGIFVRYIPIPSSMIAMIRGVIGALFLIAWGLICGPRIKLANLRGKLLTLCITGVMIGFNWILLFEAYQYTTVATATLCYYFAPIFMILASPFVLKEKLTPRKVICVVIALIGMVLISNVLETGSGGEEAYKGVLYGLAAALLYAAVVLTNKQLGDISGMERTTVQISAAAVVLMPYVVLTGDLAATSFTSTSLVLLIILGILHTGMAYAMYFGAMPHISTQTIALYSYIDPILAILLSAIFLKEPMTLLNAIGAVLILGATFISERPSKSQ